MSRSMSQPILSAGIAVGEGAERQPLHEQQGGLRVAERLGQLPALARRAQVGGSDLRGIGRQGLDDGGRYGFTAWGEAGPGEPLDSVKASKPQEQWPVECAGVDRERVLAASGKCGAAAFARAAGIRATSPFRQFSRPGRSGHALRLAAASSDFAFVRYVAAMPKSAGPLLRLQRLGRERRGLLVEAVGALALSCAAVAFLPFRRAIRLGSVSPAPGRSGSVSDCVWAIEAAARRTPLRAVCIQKGLALQRMLRRRGADARLHYGRGTNLLPASFMRTSG